MARKSDEERAGIRRNAKAARQSGKDRTAHEAARGVSVPTLADLSREYPTEDELSDYQNLIALETDRGAAVMASALVEQALTVCIQARLSDPGETIRKTWFEGPAAPFGTFAAKIKLGRALAIYGGEMESRLNLIKDVRNAFAHRSRPLDFEHPALAQCGEILPPKQAEAIGMPMRVVFSAACLAVAKVLVTNAEKHGGKTIEVDFQ